MHDLKSALAEWDRYCNRVAARYSVGRNDPEDLKSEAQVVIWGMIERGKGEESKLIKVAILNRLRHLSRTEVAEIRDARRTDLSGLMFDDAPSFDPEIENRVAFREGLARLVALADEDERALLDLMMNGSEALQRALLNRDKLDGRTGIRMYAEALGWTVKRARNARKGLQRKATIAFN